MVYYVDDPIEWRERREKGGELERLWFVGVVGVHVDDYIML